jgi:hypothetical protein
MPSRMQATTTNNDNRPAEQKKKILDHKSLILLRRSRKPGCRKLLPTRTKAPPLDNSCYIVYVHAQFCSGPSLSLPTLAQQTYRRVVLT